MEKFWRWMVVMDAHKVNILDAIKLYAQKWVK